MMPAQRRDLLLSRLRTEGRLVAKDLAAEFGVAEDSIRRDLRDTAAAGLCHRVYGGALPVSPAVADYATPTAVAPTSKRRVAEAAVQLIRPGGTVLLDGGTTALAVAAALPSDLEVTVVTHSPTIAAALRGHPCAEVLVLGGRLLKHSAVTCGAAAAEAAAMATAELFLLGVTGVHHRAGLTTGDADEAAMKRILSGRAADTWVLASQEKIGAASCSPSCRCMRSAGASPTRRGTTRSYSSCTGSASPSCTSDRLGLAVAARRVACSDQRLSTRVPGGG